MKIPVFILKNYFFILIGIFIFIGASFFFKLNLFGQDLFEDGFFSQINFISNGDNGLEGLGYLHYARFISVYPFFLVWLLELPNYLNALLLSVILLPVISFKAKSKDFKILQLLILFLPFFFSIRVTLGACSFAYLYVYLFSSKKSLFLLIISLLFSLLSSGTFICYFLIMFLYRKVFSTANKNLYKILVVCLVFFIGLALQNKYEGVSSGASGYSDEGQSYTGVSAIWGLLVRGTFIVSMETAQYARATAYACLYLIGVILTMLISGKEVIKKEYLRFFVPMLIIFWFEGMGFVSYQYCFFLFVINNFKIGQSFNKMTPSNPIFINQ